MTTFARVLEVGWILWGLPAAAGGFVLGYLCWLWWTERRER